MSIKILFVCGRNQWRSPTAERIFKNDARVEARSAGTSAKSKRQVRLSDLEWADLILVMERKYAAWIRDTFRGENIPTIDSLEIPDEYPYMDEALIELIETSVETYLTQ
ncbi:MAG: protein tyrosine phosphatase [Opitutaceae bacterium]